MKSTFLNVALLSLLVAAVPVGVSSCKDYDSEIDQLQQEDVKINSQLSALQTALQQAQSEAAAAKALAQQALDTRTDVEAVNAIAKQAAAEAKAAAIQEAVNQCKELLKGYATTADLEALATKVNAIDPKLNTLDAKIDEVKATAESLKTQVAALEAFKAQIDALGLNDATTGYAALSNLVNTINGQVAELLDTVNGTNNSKGLKDIIADLSAQVAAINSNLLVLNGETLYGLVFIPEFYYEGIEAVEAAEFEYYAVTVTPASNFASAYNSILADAVNYPSWAQTTSTTPTYLLPDLVARYLVNPSSAVVPADLAAYNLDIVDKKYVQDRAALGTVIKKDLKDGVLTITARLTQALIQTISEDNAVTTMRLEVTTKTGEKGDTVITSDYAAIFPNNYNNLGLYFTAKTPLPHTPLYATATEAIEAAKADPANCIDLAWNNSDGLNIAQLVHTEYTNAGTAKDWDKNATDGIVGEYNFSYQFDLVGWANTSNGTSESAHANTLVDDLNVYLRAQMVKDGKQQAWGAEQARATVGRMPLVRVFLVDNNNNKNAAVGYMIFNITKEAKPIVPVVVPLTPAFDEAWTLQCPLQGFQADFTWFQVEEQILNSPQVDMSKNEFEATYTPALDDNGDLTQFVKGADGKFTVATAADYIGSIKYSTNADEEDYGTNVISWVVSGSELYNLFVTKKLTTLTTYGCFVGKDGNKVNPIYFAVTYTPKSIDYAITSELANNIKISNYWYTAWSNNPGYGEIHQNVKVPNVGETAANCTFTTSILNYFMKDAKLALQGIGAQYKGLQDANLNKYFTFTNQPYNTVGVSGREYQVYVKVQDKYAATSYLYAKGKLAGSWEGQGQQIAQITLNPVNTANYETVAIDITYAETPYAKDILSKYNSQQLGQNETVWGQLSLNAQDQNCGINVPVTNNTFNVRFLRPVNMFTKEIKAGYDAATNGVDIALADGLSFADWRYNNAESLFSSYKWYYTYYGFESIAIGKLKYETAPADFVLQAATSGDIAQYALTNLGQADGKIVPLTNVTDKLLLTYTPSSNFAAGDLGTVNYKNNGETIHTAFDLYLPIVVSYKWGWLVPEDSAMPGYIKITIDPTIGQN